MSAPIPLRRDFDASQLRSLARRTNNGPQARRLLALAAIYDGATRTEAAKIGGIGLQIIRDWVLRFNANPGGSLEATRRSFNKDFLLALAADFKKHGAAAIEKVRKTQPAAYMKICALLVPREMKLEHPAGLKP